MVSSWRTFFYSTVLIVWSAISFSFIIANNQESISPIEDEIEQAAHSLEDNAAQIDEANVDDEEIEVTPAEDYQLESEEDNNVVDEQEEVAPAGQAPKPRIIKDIIIVGNKHIPSEPILNRIPYQPGEIFTRQRTNKLIRNVYDLGYFRQVKVYAQPVNDDSINLIVAVDEKRLLEEVKFQGNKHISEKEVKKKVDFAKVPSIDEDDLPKYIKILKKLYRDKDYHDVDIAAQVKGDCEKAILHFAIKEGRRTLIKRVCFTGNDHFLGKKLRTLLFTREDWVLGFLDRAGSYQPDAIEADKFVIENFYQSNGFLTAKVRDVSVDIDERTKYVTVTFHIHEGEQYTISDVRVPGNEVISEEELLARLPVRVGQLYSKEKIRETIELLRVIWGSYGYINADIEPSIQPNDDEKTVSIAFYTELGSKVYVNNINIIGNCKTHDKVIRRMLVIEEGGLLTTHAMDESKNRVEGLGYFDQRDGVNWRINRNGKDSVDLDLIVKEVKTGKVEAQIGFGGTRDISSPTESFNIGVNVTETNLFGRGINLNSSATLSKEERNLLFSISDPWLFDKPIHGAFDVYLKRSLYDEFKLIEQPEIKERITGGTARLGALSAKLNDATILGQLGVDGITYNETPIVKRELLAMAPLEAVELQAIFDRRFASGAFLWVGGSAFKDVRNHPVHPSRGYQWAMHTKFSIHSNLKDNPRDNPAEVRRLEEGRVRFGYAKFNLDASWYTPLIGERDLVLCLHGYFGIVAPFKNRSVPFRELYHVGGPASIRGFLYGEIGPRFFSPTLNQSDMLGAKKAFWLNAEMIFPISSDFSMKGAVFYDGGAGWDTPDSNLISPADLRNNSFSFRHSVGFGVRILRPTPVKIDWGFKLDRKRDETASQVHFSMYHEF
ncbi:MAG: outer membrane protein assembly factor BamA [Candidatus Babeliales bacterium]